MHCTLRQIRLNTAKTSDLIKNLTFDLDSEAGGQGGPNSVDGGAEEAAVGAGSHANAPVPTVHDPVAEPAHLEHAGESHDHLGDKWWSPGRTRRGR
jgi:hypothetical protein